MARVIIGAIPAAIAMFIISFIFFGTPLYGIAANDLPNAGAASVQQALAANLPATGTYHVPAPSTPEQTVMYGQGPIGLVHYNTDGFSTFDVTRVAMGLFLAFMVALLMGAALIGIDRRVPDFGSRARVVVIFVVAVSAFIHLGAPLMFHLGWGYFIYTFIADVLTLSAGGLIIARWFLPNVRSAPADAPTDV